MNRPPARDLHVGLIVPGLQGGVDEAAHYIAKGNEFAHIDLKLYQTKGLSSWRAPFKFAVTLTQIVIDRLRGNLDVAHVNVSANGSTLRKVMISGLLRIVRVPYIVQVHSGRYERFWDSLPTIGKTLVRPMFRHASRTVVLGHPFSALFVSKVGVDSERLAIVPNGVPVPRQPTRQNIETPTILFLGRLDQNKGYRDLLAALHHCIDLNWTAILMGDGETDHADALVERYGLGERVTVRDWTERTLVNEVIQTASILVSPSYSEGLSLTLLEAMAHGLACIATPVGGHRDVLVDEHNSLVVQPGQIDHLSKALRRLVTDHDLRTELGTAARKTITLRCSLTLICAKLEETYRNAVNE